MKLLDVLAKLNSFEKGSFLKILDNIIDNNPKEEKEIDRLRNETNFLKILCQHGADELIQIFSPEAFLKALAEVLESEKPTMHNVIKLLEPNAEKRSEVYDLMSETVDQVLRNRDEILGTSTLGPNRDKSQYVWPGLNTIAT